MGILNSGGKVQHQHQSRKAVIYVRQSTISQERRNTGSKARQYDLVDLALELGWTRENINVVDQDQATSASSLNGREAFKSVLTEVALGRVGAIFCLMVDRLSRSDFDWPQIFKICQVTDTLIIDEEKAWDLNDHNDLTMMGIKGAISASESRLIRSRCRGGTLKKAESGSLKLRLPTGLVRDERGLIVVDPDEQVRQAVRSVFELFDILPSARAVVTYFNEHRMRFPTRIWGTERHGELTSGNLLYTRVISILHNPAYAGAYVWGRTRVVVRLCADSLSETRSGCTRLPLGEWQVTRTDAHQGYISWERYLRNLERLRGNVHDFKQGSPGAIRQGAALLTGIILCGKCGRRMNSNYKGPHINYHCTGDGNRGASLCQSVQGWYLDAAVANSLLEAITPAQLRMSLRAVERVEDQRKLIKEQWNMRLEHAQYEAERVHRHLVRAEPEYELVTRTLRREWEDKLRAVQDLERQRDLAIRSSPQVLTAAERRAVVSIAKDLPLLWHADTTTPAERKQFLRFLVKDVTVVRQKQTISVAIRWQTGASSMLEVPIPHRGVKLRTDPELIALIRRLSADHTNRMIADYLNRAGLKTKMGKSFTSAIVQELRYKNKIPNKCPALTRVVSFEPRGDGRVGTKAAARLLNVGTTTINKWCREGRLDCTRDAPGSPLWIKLDKGQIRKLKSPLRRGHPAPTPRVDPSSAQAIRDTLVSDAVWDVISPLMPPEPKEISGGRPRVSNRALLCAVIFILRHEITWWVLPETLGCGCGINCRRRFLKWLKTGSWRPIQEALIKLLPDGSLLAWQRTFV